MTPNLQLDVDTIAAIATPNGKGGVSIIRISGPQACPIGEHLTQRVLKPRTPLLCKFTDSEGSLIDEGLTLFFKSPSSFTGEDVVELHGHGGVVITNLLLQACLDLGARIARPGEFSERAFLNDKLDLAQAEGLADLIDAPTQHAARQAAASLRGEFSKAVNSLNVKIIELRVYIEAAIDFPEEEIDFLSEGGVMTSLISLQADLSKLIRQAQQGALMSRGARVVITGAPNAGKSSLLNHLAKDDIAIVTEIPGTTRDVIRQSVSLRGIAVEFSDTAGIRDTTNTIEQEGITRALMEVAEADIIIVVIDDTAAAESEDQEQAQEGTVIRVLNKIDLSSRPSGLVETKTVNKHSQQLSGVARPVVAVSATSGEGIEILEDTILEQLGVSHAAGLTPFSARERHVRCLQDAAETLQIGIDRFDYNHAGELLAEDLRSVHNQLGEITGAFGADELLGEIFSSFCIGK